MSKFNTFNEQRRNSKKAVGLLAMKRTICSLFEDVRVHCQPLSKTAGLQLQYRSNVVLIVAG